MAEGQQGAEKLLRSYIGPPRTCKLVGSTLGELLDEAAVKWSSRDFLYDIPSSRRLSFQQVKDETDLLASGFLQLGLEKGDRIGIWGLNGAEWLFSYVAAAKIGVINVPLNPGYEAQELRFAANHTGVKALVIGPTFHTRNFHKTLMEAAELSGDEESCIVQSSTVPSLKTVIFMGEEAPEKYFWTMPRIKKVGAEETNMAEFKEYCKKIQCDDVLQLQPTSGTTGRPKFAMNSHHSVINSVLSVAKRLNVNKEDKYCLTPPFCHIFGTIIGIFLPLHAGCSAVIPSPVFSPTIVMETTSREKCTWIFGTPTMHQDMLNLPNFQEFGLSSVRGAIVGGAPLPASLSSLIKEKYGIQNVFNVYGATEMYLAATTRAEDDPEVSALTVGYPNESFEIKIVDQQGQILSVGEVGEICVRSITVMQGYWNEPEKTEQVIDNARWYHTGDLGFLRESGHLLIVGRLTDMLIRGGENIYPKEIEEFLQAQPGISEVYVFGVPDQRLGEVVAAWVLPTTPAVEEGSTPCFVDSDYVKNVCVGQISRAKIPVHVKILDSRSEFPQTTSGKVQKNVMREKFSRSLDCYKQNIK